VHNPGVTSLDFGYRFHIDLPGSDGQSLYLKVEVGRLNPCPSPLSSGFKEERKLLDCEDPFVAVPPNGLRGHAIKQAQVVSHLCLLATDTFKWARWAVLVENNKRRLRRMLGRPLLYVLKNRPYGLEQRSKVDSVALAVNRYNISRGRTPPLEVSEDIPSDSQLEHLLFFYPMGAHDDHRFVHMRVVALIGTHKDITMRLNIRGLKVGFREGINPGGQGSSFVGADGGLRLLQLGQIGCSVSSRTFLQ
jgi:hypothetical protein